MQILPITNTNMFIYQASLLEVILAAVVATIGGMVWFGPFLGPLWIKEMGYKPKELAQIREQDNMSLKYVMGFAAALVAAYVLATLSHTLGVTSLGAALKLSFFVWIGFTAPAMLNKLLWGDDSHNLFAIEVVYQLVSFLLMGTVIFLV